MCFVDSRNVVANIELFASLFGGSLPYPHSVRGVREACSTISNPLRGNDAVTFQCEFYIHQTSGLFIDRY